MSIKIKTNVMRILDGQKIPYQAHYYGDEALSGIEVATLLQQDPAHVFKTLVTVGASKKHYVFVIPVAKELSLKKAAVAVGEKNIAMIKSKDLLALTGYIHGGCSPIGMKKFFHTTLDTTVHSYESIMFSAGKVGYQVEISPADLASIIRYAVYDLTI